METYNDYPYEIKDLDSAENDEILKHFKESYQDGYIRVGPHGYFFSNGLTADAANLYNIPLRSDDVFVITFPKTGTTWTQELVWMVANDLDYEKSASTLLPQRFPFLEMSFLLNSERGQTAMKAYCKGDERLLGLLEKISTPGSVMMATLPSPRFIKTHLPLSLLPPSLLDTTKVVYVARDPRDVAVSYYHHTKLFTFYGYSGDFKSYWSHFIKDQVDYAPFFPHVLEAWKLRHHPNMLFMFYEDMLKDLPDAVRRVGKFFGKEMTDEQVAKLSDHLSFDNFKNNKSVNYEFARELGWFNENRTFMRKGKSGDWRDHFDEEMEAEAQKWIDANLRGTDLRFPQRDDK